MTPQAQSRYNAVDDIQSESRYKSVGDTPQSQLKSKASFRRRPTHSATLRQVSSVDLSQDYIVRTWRPPVIDCCTSPRLLWQRLFAGTRQSGFVSFDVVATKSEKWNGKPRQECQWLTPIFKISCGCTALNMLKWRKMTEQSNATLKSGMHLERLEVLSFGHYLQGKSQGHHTIDCLVEREVWKEKVLDDLFETMREGHCQILELFQRQHWRNFWETGWSAYGLFWEHRYPLELNLSNNRWNQMICSSNINLLLDDLLILIITKLGSNNNTKLWLYNRKSSQFSYSKNSMLVQNWHQKWRYL